jgi:AraC-like DNA-binding protein
MSTATRVSPAFARAFKRVHEAFGSTPEEIEEAKAAARASMVSAEDSYYATAAMLEAGWDPKAEQAAAFLARTGCTIPSRWPVVPSEHVKIRWPEKLRAAA